MTKGIKRVLTTEEEIVELDRLLLSAVRRIMTLAERLRKIAPDEKARDTLERYFSKHALAVQKKPETAPDQGPVESEARKHLRRFDRYLAALPESDLNSVLDLVKSMYRSRRPSKLRKAGRENVSKKAGAAGEGAPASPGT